ncbi:MAG: hypothetical protein HY055_07235 [Magnetospirillum sp.]|nr:hypothetical protein [Magnetospirillum sp.]
MLRFPLILALALIASPAFSWVVECPLKNPENPELILSGAGNDAGDEMDADIVRRGDRWHETEYLEKWHVRDAILTCTYRGSRGRGHDIVLKVPGLMVRCDYLAQDVLKPRPVEPGTGGPLETRFLRVWCTSRP